MTGNSGTLRSSRLRYAKFKPGEKLTAYYDVALEDTAQPAPVAATWFCNGGLDTLPDLAGAELALRRDGVPARFSRLWATDMSTGMLVLASPLDPAFPGLGPLSDPERVAEVLKSCIATSARRNGRCTVRTIRYRPAQRHVLEYRSARQPRFFAKLYQVGGAGRVAGSVNAFAALVDAADVAGVRAVRPAAILDDAEAILYRRASGMPLSRWLRAERPLPQGRLERMGRLLRAVHSMPPPPAPQLRERGLGDEVDEIRRTCAAVIGLRPDLGDLAAGIVERAREQLQMLEGEPVALVHGDMKADHLFLGPDEITVLDTDKCALADPALDVGKLIADLRWWAWISGRTGGAAEAELLAGYAGPDHRLARARMYAVLLLVKMAARRICVAHRYWAAHTRDLLALAAEGLLGEAS